MATSWASQTLWGRINDRWNQVGDQYSAVNSSRDVITEIFRPDLMSETDQGLRGLLKGANIYEGTPSWAARVMATGFQGNLVSQSIDWIMYEVKQLNLKYIDALDSWTQDIKDHMRAVYQDSTFYKHQPQFTLDGLTIGSPIMIIEEDEDILSGKIFCLPQHYKHCRVLHDKYGRVAGLIIRDPTWTAKQIYDKFGGGSIESAKTRLSSAVFSSLNSGQYNDEYVMWRAIFKADDGIWDGSYRKPYGDYKWLGVYFEDAPTKPNGLNEPLMSDIYHSRPFVKWDYDRKFYEVFSRTPAFEAVWDAESNNEAFGAFLENMAMKNRPPRYMLDTMKGRTKFTPEAEMYVTSQEYKEPPKALDLIGDVQLTKELNDILMDKIRRWFHLDLFQLFTSAMAMNRKQPLTATQIWQMAGEKATLLSPAIETHSEYLREVDDRMMGIEIRAGRGPFAPDVIANIQDVIVSQAKGRIEGLDIIPRFIGPLAKAQKIQQKIEPIRAGLEFAAQASQALGQPELASMIIKPYETFDDGLLAVDFPAKNVNSKADFFKNYQALQQQGAQQKQFENTIEAAKALKGHNQPVDDKSVIGQLTGQGKENAA
jgi:hypothetical protein